MMRSAVFSIALAFILLFGASAVIGNDIPATDLEAEASELRAQWNLDAVQRSISLLELAAAIREAQGDVERSADDLREIADGYLMLGNTPAALRILDKAAKLERRMSTISSKTLGRMAFAHVRLGHTDKALSLSDRAVRQSLDRDRDSRAWALYYRGMILYEIGEYRKAVPVFEEALGYWTEKTDARGRSRVLIELSYGYMTSGDFVRAMTTADEAIILAKNAGDLQLRVLATNAFGIMKSRLGKKQEALRIFLQVEREFPEGVNSLEKGGLYNYLAKLYSDFDQLELAQSYHLKALAIYRQEKNLFAELYTLPRLGLISYTKGDDAAGNEYFKRGFDLAERLKNKWHLALLHQDLGQVYMSRDDKKAKHHNTLALRTFEELGLRQQYSMVLNRLGQLDLQAGDTRSARDHFEKAILYAREASNKSSESYALHGLAEVDNAEGAFANALARIKESIKVAETLHEDLGNAGLRRTYFSSITDRYELLVNLLMSSQPEGRTYESHVEAATAVDRQRARYLLEAMRYSLSGSGSLNGSGSEEPKAKLAELTALLDLKTSFLAKLLADHAGKEEISTVEVEILELEQQIDQERLKLQQMYPLYSAFLQPDSLQYPALDSALFDEKTVLLQFFLGKRGSYVWVVDRESVHAYQLPSRTQIEERVERLRSMYSNHRSIDESVDDPMIEAKRLSWELFGQVADKIRGKRLLIIPDGRLQYFPLGALPWPEADSDEPILVTNEVTYAPSASVLQLIRDQRPKEPPRKDLLVFADPVFSGDDARLKGVDVEAGVITSFFGTLRSGQSIDKLARLYESEEEAKAITRTVGGFSSDLRLGFAANREALLHADLADYKMLHFATHGVVEENRPELSGMVLSLYDAAGKQQSGGLIRLQDVSAMNLKSDLVVLSACETGIGKEVRGEGLLSLTNAFLQAGSKTVVSSLWKVDDSATRELMTELYRGMAQEELSVSAALRQAQLKLYADPRYRSPFYWAAFTIHGDNERTPLTSANYTRYTSFAGVLIGVLLAFYVFKIYGELRRSIN